MNYTASDIIENPGQEMDLMHEPMAIKWKAYFTQRAYDIVEKDSHGYLYMKDGKEYVKVFENQRIPFIIDMRVAGIDNAIPEDGWDMGCRREIDN